MSDIHINRPSGYYIGQLRLAGHRNWQTVTGKCKISESAMAKAVKKMRGYKRARVLFCDYDGWYGATVVMECNR